jgi:hypothetical protein
VDDDPHRQSLGVDQGVDLAALHLLAGVVTHRVVFTAPLYEALRVKALHLRFGWLKDG